MKKIININLSGRVIPIEDSAYEKLQAYIESLRRYFAKEEGRDEIINDIESRIAELMNEKVRKGATAVTESDIDEIIVTMGRPEDFEAEDAADAKTQSSQTHNQANETYTEPKKRRRRMYRNMSDRFLGGVCSGVANYLNIDPAIIRLFFAIVTFGGFGMGIPIYILLWIILPAKELEGYGGKRLFRNPDDKIIGGVCGGLAAYFNREPWIFRLVFSAPLLINILVSILSGMFFHFFEPFPSILFTSLSGTFVLAYIILWIVLPEARSEYEKMEMRGEKVDVNTIRQNVKDRAETFGQEVKESAQRLGARAKEFAETRGKTFAVEVAQTARPIGSGIGHAISVLFKAFFLFIAGTIAFALFVGLLALILGGVGIMPFKNFLLDGFWENFLAWGTLILFLGVPLIAIITWLVRRMMKVKSQTSYLGWTFGGLWVLGWICVTFLVASIMRDIRNFERVEQPMQITQPPNGKLIVTVNEPEIRFSGDYIWFDSKERGWDLSEDTLKMANIKLRLEKSEDSSYHVNIYKYSAGRNRADAEMRAGKILFKTSFQDSVLNVGSGISIDRESKFRGQQVVLEIQVPVGKKIRFDESMAEKLHPFSIRTSDNHGWKRNWNRRNWNVDFDFDEYFDWDVDVDYTMGSDGRLVNPNKPENEKTTNKNEYRYKSDKELKDEIQQREQKVKEEMQKIQEDKKRLNDSLNKKSSSSESLDSEDGESSVSLNSPIFSLVKFMN